MGIKAFTNFHIDEDKPESPDAEYVQYKVIRGQYKFIRGQYKVIRGQYKVIRGQY